MSVSRLERPRDRRRAETVTEIKQAALDQLAQSGTGSLSLRGVARTVGTTVQALYHYFPSREALLTELVADSHDALADAIEQAAPEGKGQSPADWLLAVTIAYRTWALAHRSAFLLLYGTPVPGFEPLPDGRTAAAAMRQARPFAQAVFQGWRSEELNRIPPRLKVMSASEGIDGVELPLGALEFFIEMRARMHGAVMLELLGHLQPFQLCGQEFLVGMTHRMAEEIDALHESCKSDADGPSTRGTTVEHGL